MSAKPRVPGCAPTAKPPTDFNDLAKLRGPRRGLRLVKDRVEAAETPAPAEPQNALAYQCTESEAARRFGDQIRDRALFAADEGSWYNFGNTRWAKDHGNVWMLKQSLAVSRAYAEDGSHLGAGDPQFQSCMATAKKYDGLPGRKRLIELVRAEPGLAILPSQFDPDPWLLNVSNGTIDLETGKLRPHNPAHRCTKIASVAFDPAAKCPKFEKFLGQVLRDEDTVAFVRRFVGYCLTGSTAEQVLLFCYGLGANGKTVLVETIQALLGDYAVTAPTSLLMAKYFEQHPCDRMPLRGARMAVFSEVPSGRRLDEATTKALTGGDRITARGMRENLTTWKPTHKILISGNYKPDIRGMDEGIWRRILLLPFGKVIPKGRRDRRLTEKLRAELPGILAWAVRGCLTWQRDGLGASARIEAATEEYRLESDRLGPFLEEHCKDSSDGVVTRTEIYGVYFRWAESQGARPMNDREFAEAMRRRGKRECFKRVEKSSVRAWRGIALVGSKF